MSDSSTIVQRLWNYCNVLRDEQRLSVVGEVPCGDDIESAVDAGLVRAANEVRLRHGSPLGEAVSRSAFEGRLE